MSDAPLSKKQLTAASRDRKFPNRGNSLIEKLPLELLNMIASHLRGSGYSEQGEFSHGAAYEQYAVNAVARTSDAMHEHMKGFPRRVGPTLTMWSPGDVLLAMRTETEAARGHRESDDTEEDLSDSDESVSIRDTLHDVKQIRLISFGERDGGGTRGGRTRFIGGSEDEWASLRDTIKEEIRSGKPRSTLPNLKEICVDPESWVNLSSDRYRNLRDANPRLPSTQLLPVLLEITDLIGGHLTQYQSDKFLSDSTPNRRLDCPNAKYTVYINRLDDRSFGLPLTVGLTEPPRLQDWHETPVVSSQLNFMAGEGSQFESAEEAITTTPEEPRPVPIRTGDTTWHVYFDQYFDYRDKIKRHLIQYASTVLEGQLQNSKHIIYLRLPADMKGTEVADRAWLNNIETDMKHEMHHTVSDDVRAKAFTLKFTGDDEE